MKHLKRKPKGSDEKQVLRNIFALLKHENLNLTIDGTANETAKKEVFKQHTIFIS